MTVMTRKQQEFLDQLIAVAGSPELVVEALKSLNAESSKPPGIREAVRRILELRKKRDEEVPAETR